MPHRLDFRAVSAAVVLLAAGALAWSTVTTSQGRISASTATDGVFTAGTIEIRVGTATDLLFDTDGLYPGREVERCVEVLYLGSIDADVRISAQAADGSGLESFIATTFEVGSGGDDCAYFVADRTFYEGSLGDLLAANPDYDRGVPLMAPAEDGDRVTVRATAQVVDDDAAQGLDTTFWIRIEARP